MAALHAEHPWRAVHLAWTWEDEQVCSVRASCLVRRLAVLALDSSPSLLNIGKRGRAKPFGRPGLTAPQHGRWFYEAHSYLVPSYLMQ